MASRFASNNFRAAARSEGSSSAAKRGAEKRSAAATIVSSRKIRIRRFYASPPGDAVDLIRGPRTRQTRTSDRKSLAHTTHEGGQLRRETMKRWAVVSIFA